MKDVAERISALPPDKQALLLARLKHKAGQEQAASYAGSAQGNAWIVSYRQPEQARLRLFCFPYAGGAASIFRTWQDSLPADVEVCGIQLPGRETRLGETAYKRLLPLVRDLAEAIYPYLDRPFAFYGHSMGALVSFELARYLRGTYARQPVCLYLAAYRAPQLKNPNIKIYHLPSEVFKVVLRADGIPETILQNEELMQAILPTLRADFELCDTYEYRDERPLDCPFLIFGGQEDVRVNAVDLELWPVHSSQPCHLSLLPGSHFFLHSAQDLLLTMISQDLEARLASLEQTEPPASASS
jgi:medium-chain acyl-[acyl-carrier-protein] hydrolase